MCFPESLAARTVKQHLVAIRFPNRDELRRPRTVQAEVNSARFIAAGEYPLRETECPRLKLSVMTDGVIDVVTKLLDAPNLL